MNKYINTWLLFFHKVYRLVVRAFHNDVEIDYNFKTKHLFQIQLLLVLSKIDKNLGESLDMILFDLFKLNNDDCSVL